MKKKPPTPRNLILRALLALAPWLDEAEWPEWFILLGSLELVGLGVHFRNSEPGDAFWLPAFFAAVDVVAILLATDELAHRHLGRRRLIEVVLEKLLGGEGDVPQLTIVREDEKEVA